MPIKPLSYDPPSDDLRIVYRDRNLLVVDKPAGLLSVPGKAAEHADCLETRVRDRFPEALLVHRLDMDTSGLMVFAMNPGSQRHLGLQFEKRQVTKTYIADVDGIVEADAGEVNLPLRCDWPNRPLQMVCHEQGRPALTGWEVAERRKERTRLRLFPKTGRSHQLRVHMLSIGHPILGDRFYAPDHPADRLHLHATTLELHNPDAGNRIRFDSPCPF